MRYAMIFSPFTFSIFSLSLNTHISLYLSYISHPFLSLRFFFSQTFSAIWKKQKKRRDWSSNTLGIFDQVLVVPTALLVFPVGALLLHQPLKFPWQLMDFEMRSYEVLVRTVSSLLFSLSLFFGGEPLLHHLTFPPPSPTDENRNGVFT